jgi:Mg2+-importing ATPase
MVLFGLISTCFDLLTFWLLLQVFESTQQVFQTTWFVVSLLTELAVVLVLRTQGPALRSRASRLLLWSTAAVAAGALAVPYIGPFAAMFGFVPLRWTVLGAALGIVAAYVAVTEFAKLRFYAPARR